MAKTSESDVWDQDTPDGGRAGSTFVKWTPRVKQTAKAKVVRDDWDDDDDDEEGEQERAVDDERRGDAKTNARGTKTDRMAPSRGEAEEEGSSSEIWAEANKRLPMPEFIVASASTSQRLPPPPPAAALQPALRILKRPPLNASGDHTGVTSSGRVGSASPGLTSGSGSGSTSPAPRGTFAEREAQYQEARSRIFGQKDKSGQDEVELASGRRA